jgi:hypothetical protein
MTSITIKALIRALLTYSNFYLRWVTENSTHLTPVYASSEELFKPL